jgi:hypothetical protein
VGHDQQVHFAENRVGEAFERRMDVTALEHCAVILAPNCSPPPQQQSLVAATAKLRMQHSGTFLNKIQRV